jgi:hypothetical protein
MIFDLEFEFIQIWPPRTIRTRALFEAIDSMPTTSMMLVHDDRLSFRDILGAT